MAKLWIFGDSFSDYFLPQPECLNRHWRHEYIDFKGYVPKIYVEIIAETLGLELINRAYGGVDNNFIFEEYCKECENIQADDIVIFGWTNQQRFRLVNKRKLWGYFNPSAMLASGYFAQKPIDSFELLSESTIQELLLNRLDSSYTQELGNWVKLINLTLRDTQKLHWTWDDGLKHPEIFLFEHKETVKKETRGLIQDGHWAEKAHKDFADFIIKQIKTGNKKIGKKLL